MASSNSTSVPGNVLSALDELERLLNLDEKGAALALVQDIRNRISAATEDTQDRARKPGGSPSSVQRTGNVLSPQFRRHDHRVLTLVFSPRPPATVTQLSQYRQDIWDSFPRLRKPAPMLTVHPYHQIEE